MRLIEDSKAMTDGVTEMMDIDRRMYVATGDEGRRLRDVFSTNRTLTNEEAEWFYKVTGCPSKYFYLEAAPGKTRNDTLYINALAY